MAIDGSDYSHSAIEFITSRQTLAKFKPKIEVLNVQLPFPPRAASIAGVHIVHAYHEEEADNVLQPAQARLREAGFDPVVQYKVGQPAREITALAEQQAADLLVLGSHGRSALAGLLLGSVTTEVLARTDKAVLIIRARHESYADSLRVGIAVDGSPYGPAAAKFVQQHMPLFGAEPQISLLHVVHTYDLVGFPSAAGIAPPAFSAAEIQNMQDKAFEAAMRPVRELLAPELRGKISEIRLVGPAGDQLAAYAREHFDLLVMGSHGYGAFKSAVMGSVATRVAAHCTAPLLLIRRV